MKEKVQIRFNITEGQRQETIYLGNNDDAILENITLRYFPGNFFRDNQVVGFYELNQLEIMRRFK